MVDTYTAILQKYIVKAFRENNITYATNRAENLTLPYLKLWEINTWIDEFKTHNEVEVRFTWWLWDYDKATKSTLQLLKTINTIVNNSVHEIPEIMTIEKEKEAIRDAQKPDTKCTVIVYKFKLYGGK